MPWRGASARGARRKFEPVFLGSAPISKPNRPHRKPPLRGGGALDRAGAPRQALRAAIHSPCQVLPPGPEPIFSLAYHFTQIILSSYRVISTRFCDVTVEML